MYCHMYIIAQGQGTFYFRLQEYNMYTLCLSCHLSALHQHATGGGRREANIIMNACCIFYVCGSSAVVVFS